MNRGKSEAPALHTMLQLPEQQVSMIVVTLILGAFFIFIAGYYWGKRQGTERALEGTTAQALADKVYTAAYHELYGTLNTQQSKPAYNYYIQVGTFGTRRQAEAYKRALESVIDMLLIRERTSSTSRGKLYIWYDIVTPVYATLELAEFILEKIKTTVSGQPSLIIEKERESV